MKRSILISLLLALGCARGPGQPFATLEATLATRFELPAEREAGGGFAELDNGFAVRTDELRLTVEEVLLTEPSGAPSSFDPNDPPAGCSICHGGHCDCGGAQLTYAEAAALGGGGAGASTVVALTASDEVDFLAPSSQLLACDPSCELGASETSAAQVHVEALRLMGAVRDLAFTAPRIPDLTFTLVLTEAELPIGFPLALPANNEEAPEVGLTLDWVLTPTLFEGIAWDAVHRTTNEVDLNHELNAAAREQLLENLRRSPPATKVERAP